MIIAGEFRYQIYESAILRALQAEYAHIEGFKLGTGVSKLLWDLEQYLCVAGPATRSTIELLIERAKTQGHRSLLLWRPITLGVPELRRLRSQFSHIVLFNNDNPFGSQYSTAPLLSRRRRLWRNYRELVSRVDVNLVYRAANLKDVAALGAKRSALWRSYFVPELHYMEAPARLTASHDVCFVGHFEEDGRIKVVQALAKAGLGVCIYDGGGWYHRRRELREWGVTLKERADGATYRLALCSAKIALCFLSKLNEDTYTRRNFEIPACGVPMLSERSEDLLGLFAEGEEALYFSNSAEAVTNAIRLLADSNLRSQLSSKARMRLEMDGHSVTARARQLMQYFPQDEF